MHIRQDTDTSQGHKQVSSITSMTQVSEKDQKALDKLKIIE